ncbi:hypothetical protein CCH79_00020705 [Gambusia affinis]|uniref:Ig-like domain-containing protein n=1 Tax=Gambusia affinis TaxID=33528 RepID=A0A315UUX8_GAMAF|nr:hypothetical protein CCH79_00020705 [Gambusia affinis]
MSDSYVIAIDFGTTYSGYVFNITTKKEKSDPYLPSWGKEYGFDTPKTPTCILFNEDETFLSFGYEAKMAYKEMSREEAEKHYFFENFKMELYNKELSNNLKIKDAIGKSMKALKVFSESLRFLKEDALRTISQTTGGKPFIPANFTWVLTVPAIWDESAKQFMREAATQVTSGFIETNEVLNVQMDKSIVTEETEDKLVIALEPEAASIWCKKLPSDGFISEKHNEDSYTCGYSVCEKFDESKHKEEKKFTAKGVEWSRDIFRKLVEEGEDLGSEEIREFLCSPIKADQKEMELRFFRSLRKDAVYVDERGVEEVGSFIVDMTGGGKVKLEIKFGSTEITATGTNLTSGEKKNVKIHFMTRDRECAIDDVSVGFSSQSEEYTLDGADETCGLYVLEIVKLMKTSLYSFAMGDNVFEGAGSVVLPCHYSGFLPEQNPTVIWRRYDLKPQTIHLRREEDDLRGQNQHFSGRTSMKSDALDSLDFSLTLRKPHLSDSGTYTCSLRDDREEIKLTDVQLQVKGNSSPFSPGSSLGSLPDGTRLEHLTREASSDP